MSRLIDPGPIEFEATVQGDDRATWVEVPVDLKTAYGRGNLVPIVATFNGTTRYQGSLAMMGGPAPMLLIRRDVRTELGVQPGDRVQVRIDLDSAPRVVTLPDDADAAIGANSAAAAAWEVLSPGRRRDFARWIEEAKRPETRMRRIDETVRKLAAGEKLR